MAKRKYKGLVVVESPAKARKIGGFLGSDYAVMASMGHVCDLPQTAEEIPEELKKAEPWRKLGVNVANDFEPYYVVPREKEKVLRELKTALRSSEQLILATDEDREGESIGWHLRRLLNPDVPVSRMVFSEITPKAIREAIAHPRQVDDHLVEAQETRRVIDRLYGYTLSPLLWKKIAPKLSAGRVQSVAVRFIVRRELERLAFKSATYWDLAAQLESPRGESFRAELVALAGKRLASGKDFDESTGRLKPGADVLCLDEAAARALADRLRNAPWVVASVESRVQSRKPSAPFTTSTLQQESNRKLGLSARETMQVAQRLYENGFITYMRTDSVHLSDEAIQASRHEILTRYGQEYVASEPRQYTTKSKTAQEAHEAIRPAGTEMKTAEELGLEGREKALYALIWKRTIASQMAEARLLFQTVSVSAADAEFRATGRHIEFPGFFRAYVEGSDDPEAALDDQEAALPRLEESDRLGCRELQPVAHETKPPARYTEASLVATLENEGIGRPSTYASIIGTIQDRGYVVKQGNQLVPTFTAMAVTRLLEQHFPQLVDEKFTAKMEQQLDDIANGEAERLPYLRQFYLGREGLEEQVRSKEEYIDPRTACTLALDGISSKVRVGRYGPYIEKEDNGTTVTASIPNDITPADLSDPLIEELIQRKQQGPQALGTDPESGEAIYLLVGPYGPYLQLGEQQPDGPKPKRVSIPKNIPADQVTLDVALQLLRLPRILGKHPLTGKTVTAGVGMYGPYVLHDKKYKAVPKHQSVLTIGLDEAVELLNQETRRGPAPIRDLGPHPEDQQPVELFEGRYGPYVKHGKVNATIPKDLDVETLSLERAVELLRERASRGAAGGRSRGRGRTSGRPAGKTAARSTTRPAGASRDGARRGKLNRQTPGRDSDRPPRRPAAEGGSSRANADRPAGRKGTGARRNRKHEE